MYIKNIEKNKNIINFRANVLVAEDNTINQKLIKHVLESFGLNVYISSDGKEAVEIFIKRKFDLVFMDIQMPILDGIEATHEILKYEKILKQKHTPIVALTANALRGDKGKILKEGFDEYITKPLIRSKILSILQKYLRH
ncbi:MAG: hypothetical protein COB17_05495 [Sulfurimonas sp.]|nr:MAG: hypothetical protein COB17_05495 [Sulfurimonas sp.]